MAEKFSADSEEEEEELEEQTVAQMKAETEAETGGGLQEITGGTEADRQRFLHVKVSKLLIVLL
jgi:hypothetical protein